MRRQTAEQEEAASRYLQLSLVGASAAAVSGGSGATPKPLPLMSNPEVATARRLASSRVRTRATATERSANNGGGKPHWSEQHSDSPAQPAARTTCKQERSRSLLYPNRPKIQSELQFQMKRGMETSTATRTLPGPHCRLGLGAGEADGGRKQPRLSADSKPSALAPTAMAIGPSGCSLNSFRRAMRAFN